MVTGDMLDNLPKVKEGKLYYDATVHQFLHMLWHALYSEPPHDESNEDQLYKVLDEMLVHMVKTQKTYREIIEQYVQFYGPMLPQQPKQKVK